MGLIEKTDVELVEASRRGELEAFGHLVARYQDVVCAVGFSSTGDRVLGEDVAQETFLAAWRQLDRVRDVMRLRPWLCGIARNLGRKLKKRTHREQLAEPDEQAAATPSAFDELASGESERIVRAALARVPESYREVLVLYYREDQSIREVAETLGLSEDAVTQRLSRGRRYLADSVTTLVERSLKDTRPRRDLVAAVLGAIAAFSIPSRVDASVPQAKGSTMLKLTLAASAIAVVGATAYYLHSSGGATAPTATAAKPLLHYGAGPARPPALGPTSPHHLTAARQTAVGDLGMLPADADLVFGIDMTRIQQSALWQMFVAPQVSKASGLQSFVTACGFDPLASLTSMSIGLKGLGNDNVVGTIVVHGFDKTKVMTCLQEKGTTFDEHAHVTVDGDVVFLEPSDGNGSPLGFTFIDNTTAVAMFGASPLTKADVEKAAANNSGLQASPAFAELFANINSDDPLWLVIVPSSPLFPLMNSEIAEDANLQVHALYGSIDITNSIVVEAGLRLGSTDQVAQVVGEVQQKIDKLAAGGTLAQYFDQLDINADGGDVVFSVAANAGQLMNIAKSHDVHAEATPATPTEPGTVSLSANVPID
jgi:RNA polymerase sigma factor (sigma-70 family)